VVNATTNSFDVAASVGGGAITLGSTLTGPCTVYYSKYPSPTGTIANLLAGYKNSSLFFATVQLQYTQHIAAATNNRPYTPCWFTFNPYNQWSMLEGDVYSSAWQSFAATKAYD